MNNVKFLAALFVVPFVISPAEAGEALKTKHDKESYGVGVDVATNFKRLGLDLNLDALIKGMRDVYAGSKLALSDQELVQVMSTYQQELQNKQIAAQKSLMEANQKAGDEYMAKFRAEAGVVALPSGVLYQVIKEGNGPKPGATDTVETRYKGYFINGKEFDNSDRAGGAVTFNLQGVIAGWQEVLQLMPTGSQWKVAVPPQLAYGPQGAGREIGPNMTLVFEIELLSIKKSESQKTTVSSERPKK